MNEKIKELALRLGGENIKEEDFLYILENYDDEDYEFLGNLAREKALKVFSNNIYFRGIIEFSNYCKNDCYYCGIRRSNRSLNRYRLSKEQILHCAENGYKNGMRTFVLQSGEDPYFSDEILVDIIKTIKEKFKDVAITLSIGERSRESYEKLKNAGADRYLIRHEAYDEVLYGKLHPPFQKYENRMRCINDLKELGFQVGVGMMIGAPFQTKEHLAKDLFFIKNLKPHMVGIGPFVSHKDTPFHDKKNGEAKEVILLISLLRLINEKCLIPSTTSLGTIEGDKRNEGILHGANVIMPNITDQKYRKQYMLYDNKVGTETEAEESIEVLKEKVESIGYNMVIGRGDYH